MSGFVMTCRGGEGGRGRGRGGSLERVREWSHDRWGEPLEVEDLLPDYLAAGKAPSIGTVGVSLVGWCYFRWLVFGRFVDWLIGWLGGGVL